MAFACHMNFQPRFDSGKPLDGNLLPVVPKREPELAKKQDDRKARGLIARLSLIGFISALASRATDRSSRRSRMTFRSTRMPWRC